MFVLASVRGAQRRGLGRVLPLSSLPTLSKATLTSSTGQGESPQAAVQRLLGVMEEAASGCSDTFQPSINGDGHLVVDLGSKGQYSMQAEGAKLLVFSPVSGPCYYQYDSANRWWSDPTDGHLLDEKLVREMMHITSVYLNL